MTVNNNETLGFLVLNVLWFLPETKSELTRRKKKCKAVHTGSEYRLITNTSLTFPCGAFYASIFVSKAKHQQAINPSGWSLTCSRFDFKTFISSFFLFWFFLAGPRGNSENKMRTWTWSPSEGVSGDYFCSLPTPEDKFSLMHVVTVISVSSKTTINYCHFKFMLKTKQLENGKHILFAKEKKNHEINSLKQYYIVPSWAGIGLYITMNSILFLIFAFYFLANSLRLAAKKIKTR